MSEILLAASPVTRKLDLACGQTCKEGFEGVDIAPGPGVTHAFNLLRYPWPFEDSSVVEMRCSHFIEHIPAIEVDPSGQQVAYGEGQDALFRFFDECHRVLAPDAWFEVIWPSSRSDRAFMDPTHRRYIPEATMAYLWKDWRVGNKLDHYKVSCNFVSDVGMSMDLALHARNAEVQRRYVQNYWNGTHDFIAKLKAIK